MTASWRPDLICQVAFNADPNDAAAVPAWVDLTNSFLAANEVTRGRQYELAQTMATQPEVIFRDVDEYLNPANPSSPYTPNVQPYRQVILQAMWPNSGSVAGNLINTGGWRTNPDPTFESYDTGEGVALPLWVVEVGGPVNPAVMNAQTIHP